jgi:hypothetical protein
MRGLLLILAACGGEKEPTVEASVEACSVCEGGCLLESIPSPGAAHTTEPIDYADRPPTGGDHNPCWAEWGVHVEAVEDERWVHNLEHGGVAFLYNCPAGCPDEVAAMTALVEGLPAWALLSPYSEMEAPFAVVSWQRRLVLQCADIDAMRAFYEDNVNHAPESTTSMPSSGCMEPADSGG